MNPLVHCDRASATFPDHEPVFASLPGQIPGAAGPTFGRHDIWPGTCVRRPANRVPASWMVGPFPLDPRENLLARELAFCLLNPTHSALRQAGIFLKPNQWGLRTASGKINQLSTLLDWAREQALPEDFGDWEVEDWQAFIDARAAENMPGTVRSYVAVIRHLVLFAPGLTGVSSIADPWPGRSNSEVADCPWSEDLSTAPIPPEVWWPLLRAAWAYIGRFAPAILGRRDHKQKQSPRAEVRRPAGDADRRLDLWLANPSSRVPLTARSNGRAQAGEPMWNEIGRQVLDMQPAFLFPTNASGDARKEKIRAWIAATGRSYDFDPAIHTRYWPQDQERVRRTPAGFADDILKKWLADPSNLIPVHPDDDQTDRAGKPNWSETSRLIYGTDDNTNPLGHYRAAMHRRAWVVEAAKDPARVRPNDDGMGIRMLRAACYVFVAALTAMRDSEIQEITRGSVTQHYGAPAVESRKIKRDPSRPRTYWWIIAPVAQAIAVAEQVTWHESRVFTSVTAGLGVNGGGFAADMDIDDFIATVNANRDRTGLEEIPAGLVRPHMFRRTMSVLAAQEPDGEIALGLQLKHAARRALSNRLTLSYGKADTKWAKEFDTQMERAAAKKLVALLQARRSGQTVAVGPGAGRFHAGLDKINTSLADEPALRAQLADERLQATLLQGEFANLHLGTINHCLWNAPTAECQNQLPVEQRGQAPLLGACQPSRCRNSVLTLAHERVWRMEEADLLAFLEMKLSKPLREQAQGRLAEVRSTNTQFDTMKASV
ncbi:hypothetical protein [Kitasatospora sp. GP82]|uniref:hypothetical protein n=1 Tax=Kitasatospora sp. GP82 TaxID=3035089 RepID=UPI002476D677|nr:hypothetical protein [Kitasatospora sp. GP82]MDH6128826.1 integrase [Kitasatospora sp. GP82]